MKLQGVQSIQKFVNAAEITENMQLEELHLHFYTVYMVYADKYCLCCPHKRMLWWIGHQTRILHTIAGIAPSADFLIG